MTKTFSCPACGGPLNYAGGLTMLCPYCHNTIIVPEELRGGSPSANKATSGRQIDPDTILQEIRTLLKAGQKIPAIKVFRQATSASLKEAKVTVEAIEAGVPVDLSRFSIPTPGISSSMDSAAVMSQATKLILEGKKIDAIKLLREQFDVSLKVAKEATELLEKGQPVDVGWLKEKANQLAFTASRSSSKETQPVVWETTNKLSCGIILFIVLLTAVISILVIFLLK